MADFHSVENGEAIVQTALDTYGRIDIVINNAGILRDASFHKMTNEDWELVYRVHLHGAYQVTHAAWPHLREVRYGRVVMTSSGAGLYGNFGQANYSSCKLGLLGLAKTLAAEGADRNIFCNTIAPVAGSRLTATVMPPELVETLKPEYVSPLVAYLCHETSTENGGLFELGAGWFSRLRWQRSRGVTLSIAEEISIEDVAKRRAELDDWTDAETPATAQDTLAPLMAALNGKVSSPKSDQFIDPARLVGFQFEPDAVELTKRDVSLYALGIGAGRNPLDADELKFVYENHQDGFHALPTMAVTFAQDMLMQLLSAPGLRFNPVQLLHGEQYLELRGPIPAEGTITNEAHVSHVYDKGKGALVVTDVLSRDKQGREVAFNQYTAFIRGLGGFGGERGPTGEVNQPPSRSADAVDEFVTDQSQALLYRLSGDLNPLHADPAVASMGGYERPILHGLCAFGIAGRAILKHFCGFQPEKLKSLRVRFATHIFPGETLVTEMWKESDSRVVFRCRVKERDKTVLSHAAAELQQGFATRDEARAKKAAGSSSQTKAEIEEIFAGMRHHIQQSPELVDKVGGIFAFQITGDGESSWAVDLKNSPGSVLAEPPSSADCTVTIDGRDLLDIRAGTLNSQMAFMQGRLKVTGNMGLATKLGMIMK